MHEAVDHGLDMAIVNYTKIYPLYKIPQEEVDLARKLIFRRCIRRRSAPGVHGALRRDEGQTAASTTAHVDTLSVEDKLKFAIINGEKSVGEGANKKPLEACLKMR
jgi:5-methyltetrahydrofolate--homocysteine methyltransferase